MSPLVHHMLHEIEVAYPPLRGSSWFVLTLILWSVVSLSMYALTKWTEWFIGFIGAALFALPFLMQFAK